MKPVCIIKNCKNPGEHPILISLGDSSLDGIYIDPKEQTQEVYVCLEDYKIISDVNYLAIADTKLG